MQRIVLALALLSGIAAAAPATAATTTYRYHDGKGMRVIMRSSMAPIQVTIGDNPLDRAHLFTCSSAAGCMVVISSSNVQSLTQDTSSCTFVDSEAAAPGRAFDSARAVVLHQQSHVAQGQHTIQTIVHSLYTAGQITGWELTYTIYELKV
jgi:hypothetical protein